MKLDFKLFVSIASFVVFVIALLFFRFSTNPPDIAGMFKTVKNGSLVLEIEDRVVVNTPFTVSAIVDSSNQKVNAVGFYLRYEPQHLELIDFDTSGSFCQFYPEKKFDNSVGIMSLACGSPHPGFSGKSTLITLTFMPKVVANSIISVDPKSQILLSDGKGTNILETFPQERISILNSL